MGETDIELIRQCTTRFIEDLIYNGVENTIVERVEEALTCAFVELGIE